MENVKLSPDEMFRSEMQANEVNKKIRTHHPGKSKDMGKDAFLKLLVTELQHQDPTKPMEDKAFIAQMAQFSSLEQMTNIKNEIKSLAKSSHASEAFSLLGKRIDAYNRRTKQKISGRVTSIEYRNGGRALMVGNKEVSVEDIHAVHDSHENVVKINSKENK